MAQAPADQQRALLDIAELDTRIARLETDNTKHPLRGELATIMNALAEKARDKEAAEHAVTTSEATLEEAEKPVAALQEQIATKDAQLAAGTGLDSRGLLALQEEIAGLRTMLESASDKEFDALSALEEANNRVEALTADIAQLKDSMLARKAELEDAVAAIEAEKTQLVAEREALFAPLDKNLRAIYENSRKAGGYAVLAMKPNGETNAGISLSPVEVDAIRQAPEDEICISEDYDCIIVRV